MTFTFSRHGLKGTQRVLQRALEMLPGLVSWTVLLGMTVLAFWKPLTAAALVIAIDLYWLLRLFYLTVFLVLSYGRLSMERDTDWMARVRGVDRLVPELHEPDAVSFAAGLKAWGSRWMHRRELTDLRQGGQRPPPSETIHHLVIVPVAREPQEVIEPGIASLAQQTFPSQRLLVILAVEARAPEIVAAGARKIQRRYRDAFLDLLVVIHPEGLPGEARVKGANATYAAKAAAAFFRERGIAPEQVIVSCFDADTVVDRQYMACLTYHFLMCPDRIRASFQPLPMYHNNVWESPGITRVLDIGASFFQLIEATNPESLVTFSSHSMSFKALIDVGYWPVDMISDDSAIFWKSFIHFDGRYRVVPMYITVSMDVVAAKSWWKTAANVYRQKRRWAWGVENVPLVFRAFLRPGRIPLSDRLRLSFKLFEGHLSWATWPLLVTVIGWFPALCAGREFSSTVLYYSAPRITATIFQLSSLSLLVTIILSQLLLPKRPASFSAWRRLGLALEWLLVPVSVTLLSALPALEAQTRLMLGRYMEFWVTEKSATMANAPHPALKEKFA